MIVGYVGIFPLVHYKYAVNNTKAIFYRQHLIKVILLLLFLTRKGGGAFNYFESLICLVVTLSI